MPAISSSACIVRTPKFLCFDSSWRMSEAGVIGYDAEEQRAAWQLRRGDEAPGGGGVAADRGVDAGRLLVGRHGIRVVEQLGRLAEGVAGTEGGQVGVAHGGLGAELLVDPVDGHLLGTGVHPRDQPESEEVLRALDVSRLHPERLAGLLGQRRHRDLVAVEALEVAGGDRIVALGVPGLGQRPLVEGVDLVLWHCHVFSFG